VPPLPWASTYAKPLFGQQDSRTEDFPLETYGSPHKVTPMPGVHKSFHRTGLQLLFGKRFRFSYNKTYSPVSILVARAVNSSVSYTRKDMDSIEREQTRDTIKQMHGWEVHWACVRFIQCYEIFYHNSKELIEYSSNPPRLDYSFFPGINTRVQKNKLDARSAALIHNYVASTKTLVDIVKTIQ